MVRAMFAKHASVRICRFNSCTLRQITMSSLILFIILQVLDLLTTKAFLLLGTEEGNPIGTFVLKRFGFKGIVYVKTI